MSQQYLSGVAETAAFFSAKFTNMSSEVLWVAHVSVDLRCLKIAEYHGAHDFIMLGIPEIVSDAVEMSSAGIVLAHNHLSGDSTPNPEDIKATLRLCLIARDMDFVVLDHLIFAGDGWSSMRQRGLI